MGNSVSSLEEDPPEDPWWPPAQTRSGPSKSANNTETVEGPCKGKVREEELEAFKQELARKRALRHEALASLQSQLRDLRGQVEEERNLRLKAEEERDQLRTVMEEEVQKHVAKEKEEKVKMLEEQNRLMEEVEKKVSLERQIQALKDVSQIGKEMLRIRELQVKELKKKLVEINISSVVAPPEDLRLEYEKQIENIRKLRTLYEERAAATLLEHRRELEREEAKISVLETKLSDVQKELEDYKDIKKELEIKIEKLESILQQNEDELEKTKDDLFSRTAQNSSLNSQMTLINNLFSHMLVQPEVDLDRLTRHLNEHHGLITDLTMTGNSNDVAALLVDLAEQVDKEKEQNKIEDNNVKENCDINKELKSEIASNLSKVWRVMVELLSHHQTPIYKEPSGGADNCYKSVQTPSGPRSIISVSQTFLTLKDLILEKNKLVKEVGRLKTLNNHLENRLGSQEKRLSVVTTELRKTWGVVNKLKAQHKQLHTHEKILRYELQQKRCLLTELKGELEHCRDKWEKARQKNSQTEEDWKQLRKEFAARKSCHESNSAESGYEEDEVQSPPSESKHFGKCLFELPSSDVSEQDLSEEDIEHSDGNSFDTVIDLLDIACLDTQQSSESSVPFLLCDVSHPALDIPQTLIPLTGSEFTDGLDQIQSEDLATALNIEYQNQLSGVDFNLSMTSSSGSSPIPTENDDFTSSEVDVSEEDISSSDNQIYSSPLSQASSVPEDILLFGSNSQNNISRFLDGLYKNVDQSTDKTQNQSLSLTLNVPSTSKTQKDSKGVGCFENEEDQTCLCPDDLTPIISEDNSYVFSGSNPSRLGQITHNNQDQEIEKSIKANSEHRSKTHEELLKAREDRLNRLEHQCRSLVNQVTSTSFKSEMISNKLDELHLAYGNPTHGINEDLQTVEKANNEDIKKHQFESMTNPVASSSKTTVPLLPTNQTMHVKGKAEEGRSITSNSTNEVEKIVDPHVCSSGTEILIPPTEPNLLKTNSSNVICEESSDMSNRKESFDLKQKEDMALQSSDLDFESREILNQCSSAGSSNVSQETEKKDTAITKNGRTPEAILEARAERFKRLEDQCKSLLSKMTATSLRSEIISNKLDELHSCYGSSEDASDNEEHSSISKNPDKTLLSTSSSMRRHKLAYVTGVDNRMEKVQTQNIPPESYKENTMTDNGFQETNHTTIKHTENNTYDGSTILLSRISEEIPSKQNLQDQKLENECHSPLGQISSVKSDIQSLSPQQSIVPEVSSAVSRAEQSQGEGSGLITDTVKLQTDTKGSEYANLSDE